MLRISVSLLLVLGVAVAASAQTASPSPNASAAPPPAAVAQANPYSATVPVAGTSDDQRNTAIAVALTDVLQKLSPGFVASSDELSRASGYVRDFHYLRAATNSGLELQVDFDPGAIGHLIAANPAASTVAGAMPPASGSSAAAAMAPRSGSATLWVGGVDNSRAFASLLATLRNDTSLHDVTPVGAEDDGVLLHLSFDQPLTTVLAALETPADHLTQAPRPHPGADASLHWVP
ncbi:MAG TPA: DUF2066 domain-containing protein [Rhodanobacteraceae bacterium]|nr:DUF2066 domain-containing protein [Rhodanobacteraceae bacterium]